MKGIRRKYIALSAMIISVIVFLLVLQSHQDEYLPNESVKSYFGIAILLLQLILTIIIFKLKNNDAKNLITTFTVVITLIYMIMFLYSSLVG